MSSQYTLSQELFSTLLTSALKSTYQSSAKLHTLLTTFIPFFITKPIKKLKSLWKKAQAKSLPQPKHIKISYQAYWKFRFLTKHFTKTILLSSFCIMICTCILYYVMICICTMLYLYIVLCNVLYLYNVVFVYCIM